MQMVLQMPEITDGYVADVSAKEARKMILTGKFPRGLRVQGTLDLSRCTQLFELPEGLIFTNINLKGCINLRSLPTGLKATCIDLTGCTGLKELPAGMRCYDLNLSRTSVQVLPADLEVEYRLQLNDCTALRELPAGLKVGTLDLSNCVALRSLPEGLDVYFLNMDGCTQFQHWPKQGRTRFGSLNAHNCREMTALPPWLTLLSHLNVSGCEKLASLPEGLRVTSWLDIADTQIDRLPKSLKGVHMRWRSVLVPEHVVFHPETITATEVLGERNAEVRRILMERMGYDRFLGEARAEELHRDRDPGGERRLLRVPLPDDEPLVCLAVYCPSTQRQYILRVPPTMRTCHQAAAWIAGFDQEKDYRPIAET